MPGVMASLALVVGVLVTGGSALPRPQLIVKSQSNLWRQQPGRQIDLSKVLPTQELFWLNLEEVGILQGINQCKLIIKLL